MSRTLRALERVLSAVAFVGVILPILFCVWATDLIHELYLDHLDNCEDET
jgi:hypothetical protein